MINYRSCFIAYIFVRGTCFFYVLDVDPIGPSKASSTYQLFDLVFVISPLILSVINI